MLGDGLATIAAGCIGGPANTTYSENTAVLAATGNYNPASLRLAALIAIAVSFLGKAIRVIEAVPHLCAGRRLHRAVRYDFLRRPANPGGKQGGLHQKPQPLHRGRHAGAGHRRRGDRRAGLYHQRHRPGYPGGYPAQFDPACPPDGGPGLVAPTVQEDDEREE